MQLPLALEGLRELLEQRRRLFVVFVGKVGAQEIKRRLAVNRLFGVALRHFILKAPLRHVLRGLLAVVQFQAVLERWFTQSGLDTTSRPPQVKAHRPILHLSRIKTRQIDAYALKQADGVLVVKTTRQGDSLYVTDFQRLGLEDAKRSGYLDE